MTAFTSVPRSGASPAPRAAVCSESGAPFALRASAGSGPAGWAALLGLAACLASPAPARASGAEPAPAPVAVLAALEAEGARRDARDGARLAPEAPAFPLFTLALPADAAEIAPPFVMVDAATLRTRSGRVLRLAHVVPPGRSEVCAHADGARWACGLRARVALAVAMRSGPLRCAADAPAVPASWPVAPVADTPTAPRAEASDDPVLPARPPRASRRGAGGPAEAVRCWVGGADVAARLLGEGWLRAAAPAPAAYAAREASARAARSGLWGAPTLLQLAGDR